MDEKDYELLLDLNESKNITKTAQKLFMTQPAITKRIQKMEEELQCTLFLRSKKGILFTPAGEQILPYAAEILANSRKLKEQVLMSQNQICGTIRLGCSLNIAHYHLPPILKAYTDQYPQGGCADHHGAEQTSLSAFKPRRDFHCHHPRTVRLG
ncbi:MAG: LysR family transcriptional regulator [Candidatus Copromonas sp.]|nr:LysR family transcriptional regulator [Candidatus Copromonas sp.]